MSTGTHVALLVKLFQLIYILMVVHANPETFTVARTLGFINAQLHASSAILVHREMLHAQLAAVLRSEIAVERCMFPLVKNSSVVHRRGSGPAPTAMMRVAI